MINYMDVLANNCWSLVCTPCCEESYRWVVVGSYMAKPYKRVMGETFEEDKPWLAIDDAIKTTKNSIYDYKYDASLLD